jgi:uridine kinase
MIAVSGGSGSGKTTLVGRLVGSVTADIAQNQLVQVLHLDHYYRDLSHLTPDERDRQNFDHPQAFDTELLRKHLTDLRSGDAIDRPTYDFASHTRRPETVRLSPAPVIVLDGILALHWPEVRDLLDLKIFVDVSDDVRFIRRLRRDINERGRTFEGVITQYLSSVKTMHDAFVAPQRNVADIIVSWEDYNDRAVAMLAGMVRTWSSGN